MSKLDNLFDDIFDNSSMEGFIVESRILYNEMFANSQQKMNERETGLLVLSQMSFTIFGSLFNLFLFITLRDLPNLAASTYHVLLVNLSFCNILICTFIKPVTSIYVGYAFAKVSLLKKTNETNYDLLFRMRLM
jgi:hypothetical protein